MFNTQNIVIHLLYKLYTLCNKDHKQWKYLHFMEIMKIKNNFQKYMEEIISECYYILLFPFICL